MTSAPETALASPLLAAPGAVAAEGPDAGVAWHYGDPMREQRQLEAGEAAVDLSNRGVLTVTGPDRLSWLHSMTTQALTGTPAGEARETLVLSPHGHVEHDLHLVDDGATTWITVEPGTAGVLHDWLNRMRFMLRVEVADVTADWAVVGAAPALAARLRVSDAPPIWVDPWPALGPGTASYAAAPEEDHPGRERSFAEVLVPRAGLPEGLGGGPGGGRRGFGAAGGAGRGSRRCWRTSRWRAAGPRRRCGSLLGVRAWAWRPTTGPSRTRSTGCARRYTWRRAATAGRRRWPGCTTSAALRAVSSSCISTARSTRCRRTA